MRSAYKMTLLYYVKRYSVDVGCAQVKVTLTLCKQKKNI